VNGKVHGGDGRQQRDCHQQHQQRRHLKKFFTVLLFMPRFPVREYNLVSISAAFSSIFDTEQYLFFDSATASSTALRLKRPVTS